MLIKNYDLGFSFEISDEYSEIKELSYGAFGIDKSTLNYFVQLTEEGEIDKTFSLCKDRVCINEEEVKECLLQNVNKIKKAGFELIYENEFDTHTGRKVYRKVFVDEKKEVMFATYFTLINKTIVASTTQIIDFYDEYEEEMYAIFASIKEL